MPAPVLAAKCIDRRLPVSNAGTNNRPAQVLIDRSALAHNFARVRELVPDAKIMAVIKANAYGHGMAIAAQALSQADEFAVSSLDDVAQLRQHGIKKPLTLLSAVLTTSQLETLTTLNVRPVIFEQSQIEVLEQLKLSAPLSIWLKVDTGMGRLGIAATEVVQVVNRLLGNSSVGKLSLMTHLANADAPSHPLNAQQISVFEELAKQADFHQLSVLNSAGIIAFSSAAHDVVRPGLMLYGVSPMLEISAQELGLKPVMTFRSELISVKKLAKGSSIGYGSTYRLESDTMIGIVACGYGDGYPRHAPTGTPVFVNGELADLVGRVSMDMIAINLSRISAKVGDQVTLWGAGNPIEKIAHAAGTLAYELSCGITSRVARIIL